MRLFFDQIGTHARIQLRRHLRSPAIWALALAAPIAARFLVPEQSADYSVMAVNNAYLTLDPAVIGLQLGVVMAIILSPLAYIFLRAGPTRRQPWQADDLTPARRTAQMLGHWLGDTGALWILMLVLAVAGVLLSIFRLPLSKINPVVTILCLSIIAAPALSVIAGIRTIFSTRRGLRGAGGDVLFFFIWMGLIIVSAAFFTAESASPFIDVFGFAAPLVGATDVPIEFMHIGNAPSFDETLKIDALAGVIAPDYLLSRLFWIGMTGGFVALSAQVFATHKFKPNWAPDQRASSDSIAFTHADIPTVRPGSSLLPLFLSEARLAFRPRILLLLLVAIGLAGIVLPFRGMVGPALALGLIFPLTRHGARWRGREMAKLSVLTARGSGDIFIRLAATIAVGQLLCLPSLMRMIASGEVAQFTDIAVVSIGLPVIAIGLGHLTRSAVAGRLTLLILWYGYLNM